MTWKMEMDVIDQLMGSDSSLSVLASLFENVEKAKNVFLIYVGKGVVELQKDGRTLPAWEAEAFLRTVQSLDDMNDVIVAITDKGIDAFETEKWEKI